MALPELIPVEDFLRPPHRTGASISPDGTRLAFLAPWRGRLNVWIQDLDGETEPRCVTADDRRTVHRYHWTDDPRWLLYQQDTEGDENWHVYRVDLDDPHAPPVDLTPHDKATATGMELPRHRPGKLITQLNARDVARFDLYEIDIATGASRMLAENPGDVQGWLYADTDRVYTTTLDDTGSTTLSRWYGPDTAPRPVARFDGDDYPLQVFPFQVTPDGTGAWIGSHLGGDRIRLAHLDLETGVETEVDSHPEFDLDTQGLVFPAIPSPLIRHRRTGELLGVRYLGHRQVIHALDARFARVLANLEQLSDGDLAAISSDADGRRWVVSFGHDRNGGDTWFYDHDTGHRRLLFRTRPHLDPKKLAPMRPVTITARDGLRLPSYLTLPVGVAASRLPLVLLVHGGPWARDTWRFDPTVQLFANRGYAVLQVNFRGSAGFGRAHMRAGIGQLAAAMHDDLIDAVDWAVARGYADADRVAIVGGSYGGYAALVGVTFTPDRFAAAFEYVGVSNLVTFMDSVPEFAKPGLAANWHRYAGDPADPKQAADLLARSPISRVDEIRTPLFVVQGANDVRVVKRESDQIVQAVRDRGGEVEYLVFDDEGHLFVNPENLIAMHRAADRFLARHLKGRCHD